MHCQKSFKLLFFPSCTVKNHFIFVSGHPGPLLDTAAIFYLGHAIAYKLFESYRVAVQHAYSIADELVKK